MLDLSPNNQKEKIINGSYDRPAGVSILAVLLAIGGGLLLFTQLTALKELNEASSVLGVSAVLLQGSISLIGLSGVAAAVGMWIGKKWGWWLALFYFAYAVCRNVNVIISIPGVAEQLGAAVQDQTVNYVKHGIRVVWNSLLMLYLCGEGATTYFFGMTSINKWKAVLIVFAVSILIFAVTTLIA
ncbi:hypothetical protein [Paenibacillus koleovorans]|uniref:hypothetical protein n=1 Tax=Paenibacillus koleovorans TaxID=121608 RepID=UPI000FDB1A55|nr:hypothetical protein [Paenibacillus koleovorans]